MATICKRLAIMMVAGLLALPGSAALSAPSHSVSHASSSSRPSGSGRYGIGPEARTSSHGSEEPSAREETSHAAPPASTATVPPPSGSRRYGITAPSAADDSRSAAAPAPAAPPPSGSGRYGIGTASVVPGENHAAPTAPQAPASAVLPATGSGRYGIGAAPAAEPNRFTGTTSPAATGSGKYGIGSPPATLPSKPVLTGAATGSNAALGGMMAARTASDYRRAQSQAFSQPPAAFNAQIPRSIVVHHVYYDYGSYTRERQSFYGGWREPSYASRGSPSFGAFDAIFMWWMLDHLSSDHSRFFYDHQNDPGYQAWYQQAQEQSKDNAELRGKLDQLNGQMAQMKGQPVENTFMPSDVPAEMALRSDAVVQQKPDRHVWPWIVGGLILVAAVVFFVRRR